MALLAFISEFAKSLPEPPLGRSDALTTEDTGAGHPESNLQAGTAFTCEVSTRS